MKRYELRVKTGIIHMSHFAKKKYICFYNIQEGNCTKIASSDNRDVIEKRFDKENEYRQAKLTNNGIVHVVAYAVYDNERKDIIMQTAIDFNEIE